ncbi:MAG: hypothetical protein CM1200mP40_13840 [Gammaproteobacteria bacterium]|nr:MAG: hypothetical protein CM1200mP40_13840 [Gammaproteobacteria bacterium]
MKRRFPPKPMLRAKSPGPRNQFRTKQTANAWNLCRRFPRNSCSAMEANDLFEQFTPIGPNQIFSPRLWGGSNYGPLAYGKDTGYCMLTPSTNRLTRGEIQKAIFPLMIQPPENWSGARFLKGTVRQDRCHCWRISIRWCW